MSTKPSGMENADFADELELLEELKNKNIKAFATLYKEYSEDLLLFAYTLTGDPAQCHQAVDSLFIELWEKGDFTLITPPLHHFLYSEIRNRCKK